jgi:ribosomal protein S27AE
MSIYEIVLQMIDGQRPTTKSISCPRCGGVVAIGASKRYGQEESLNLSVCCRTCHAGLEMDGVDRWPGADVLLKDGSDGPIR